MTITAADYVRWQQEGGFADLSARTKLALTGADRVRFLNGQVTVNVTKLPAAGAVPAAITTTKGKLCGEVFIAQGPDGGSLLLDAEPELRVALAARLEKYIISEDVTLEDVTEKCRLLHFIRQEPPAEWRARAREASRFGLRGWDVWLSTEEAIPHRPMPAELLEVLRIEAGIPRWGAELGEDTLPPEAGLDRTHVDYHKGCYVGQETISRLRSVGHVNRELTGFLSVSGAPLAAGLGIFATDAADDARPLGQITSAAYSFALAKQVALGYLRRGSPTAGLVARSAQPAAPALEVTACALPFVSS
jgi:folate-binding protein YgfZ